MCPLEPRLGISRTGSNTGSSNARSTSAKRKMGGLPFCSTSGTLALGKNASLAKLSRGVGELLRKDPPLAEVLLDGDETGGPQHGEASSALPLLCP
eukprot:CAMPEP_0172762174 /NCGR_PEP_ID=MMETSP1074-20121228/172933_1 /TAXON_ID=2916 /ORGANISM="Ceratium fusus, Strain PA161109" /LENGTH=95 /DNA_ID=CAMNT_0013596517 /DNA_START=245 /DNA_END=532 /DNA_ORIENTATION=+